LILVKRGLLVTSQLRGRGKKLLVLVTASVLLYVYWNQKQGPSDDEYKTVELIYHDELRLFAEGTGQLKAQREHFLSVKNGGRLERINVLQGEEVAEAQVIAVVDETTRSARLDQTLSAYRLARAEQGRVQRLHRSGAATQQEVDEANNNLTSRRSDLQSARQDLEDAVIRAPFAGYLSFFAFRQGDFIPDGSRVAVLEDRSQLQVLTKLPYAQAQLLPESGTIQVALFDVVARREKGDWQTVDAELQVQRQSTVFDGAGMDVVVRFSAEEAPFPVGAPVIMKLTTSVHENVHAVPVNALLTTGGESAVALVTDGDDLKYKPVEIISRQPTRVIVRGLAENERNAAVFLNPRVLASWLSTAKSGSAQGDKSL